jgi:hypothetical protein
MCAGYMLNKRVRLCYGLDGYVVDYCGDFLLPNFSLGERKAVNLGQLVYLIHSSAGNPT